MASPIRVRCLDLRVLPLSQSAKSLSLSTLRPRAVDYSLVVGIIGRIVSVALCECGLRCMAPRSTDMGKEKLIDFQCTRLLV
jgi:hypothetical protein